MKTEKTTILQCFQLLQSVFRDAFHVPVLHFTPPYQNIDEIDQGIRASIWPDYFTSETGIKLVDKDNPFRILLIKSNLGFYNVLISFSAEESPDFLSIGPFRKEELSSSYYIKILKAANVPPASIQGIKYIYEQMPVVAPDVVLLMAKDMLSVLIPAFREVTPEHYAFADQKREVSVNRDLLEERLVSSSEIFSRHLLVLLNTIYQGQSETVESALHNFLLETKLTDHQTFEDSKMLLHTLNSYCQLLLLQSNVHPAYTMKAALTTAMEIGQATSMSSLKELPLTICLRYCNLSKKYAGQHYSKLTRDVTAYIQLHMEEELSLHQLAKRFDKNPSVLSATFHKDTGETLTRYIRKARVREAARLLHDSDLSISEIAISVGYQDFSYFSKVFSKEMGCSPRAYRKEN